MHGGMRENLSLIPVINEWKIRGMSSHLFIETTMPYLFLGNPSVDGVNIAPTHKEWGKERIVIDFDVLEEPAIGIHPIDLYALAALGDNRLVNRRISLFEKSDCTEQTGIMVGLRFAADYPEAYLEIMKRFSVVSPVGFSEWNDGLTVSRIRKSKVYIGKNEDATWLAMATDVPIVMAVGELDVDVCRPFRHGIPFEALGVGCLKKSICRKRSSFGFGNVYNLDCQSDSKHVCRSVSTADVIAAIGKVLS
jgi:hypothetical protein